MLEVNVGSSFCDEPGNSDCIVSTRGSQQARVNCLLIRAIVQAAQTSSIVRGQAQHPAK
jgi:hypothetical protein